MKNLFFTLILIVFCIGFVPTTTSAQNKQAWVSPKIGVWQVVGKDEENIGWTGQIRFTRKTNSKSTVKYRGYFDWKASDGETSGREYFTGSFDKRTGRLRLKGYLLKNVRGDLGLGIYVGSVSQKGRRIRRGSWGGIDAVKGNWSAKWLKFRIN